jgi:hypothetical protein
MSSGRPGAGWKEDGEGERDACDGGVDARAQHEEPKHRAEQQVGRQAHHTEPVHRRQRGHHRGGEAEVHEREVARVEHGDDRHRAEVVDDGQGGEEHLSEVGTRGPSRDSTPRAKAVSVADGMALPRKVAGSCQLKAA